MATQPTLSQKYEEVANNLVGLTATLGRIEERVDIFINKINSLETKVDHHVETCPVKCGLADTLGRIKVLESKNGNALKDLVKELKSDFKTNIRELQASDIRTTNAIHKLELEQQEIQSAANRGENKWRTFGWIALNVIVPIVWVTIASFILYHLGITSPPIP